MSLPLVFSAKFYASWNFKRPSRSRNCALIHTRDSYVGSKCHFKSLCLFGDDVKSLTDLDKPQGKLRINARNGSTTSVSSFRVANCQNTCFGPSLCKEDLLHYSISCLKEARSPTKGPRNRDGYLVFRILAPHNARIGPGPLKDAAKFITAWRIQKVGSHFLSTSHSIVWFERKRVHDRRGVTAHADEKAKDKSKSFDKKSEQHQHTNNSAKNPRFEVHGYRRRPGRPTRERPDQSVLLQAFNWESCKHKWWVNLKTKVEDLCSVGITDVWLPPVSQAVDRQGYLPSQLYNLDASAYGTAAELKELIDEFHRHNISCIADIVINHRSGVKQDSKGHWNIFKGGNIDKRLDWGPWAVVDDDVYDSGGKGKHDTGESYGAAPDIDHTNKQVQDELTDWMNWMRAEIGFDGWRFDFVKGYHPKYTQMYIERTKPTFAVGELWTSMDYFNGQLSWDQNRHRQVLCNWIDGTKGTCCAFDFTTKGILQRAVEGELWRLRDDNNKPSGLIGWYPQKAVTFLDNHDTGSTQRHWNFPDNRVLMGYVYILTHPGTPCIFIDHIYEFKLKNEIKKLVHLRKRHRINARSKVFIMKAEGDIYVAKIDDRVVVKLGSSFLFAKAAMESNEPNPGTGGMFFKAFTAHAPGPNYFVLTTATLWMEMGNLLPDKKEWTLFFTGWDFAVWETTRPLSAVVEVHQDEPIPKPGKPVQHQASHPIQLTSKMSEETKKRLLEEAQAAKISILTNGNGLGTPVDPVIPAQGTPLNSTQTLKLCLRIFLPVVLLGPLLAFLIL